jgi:hypothetical protein
MKRLATYIMAGFLSVGVASPAFSDVDCAFIEEQAYVAVTKLSVFQALVIGGDKDPNLKDDIRDGLRVANAWANIYGNFCK